MHRIALGLAVLLALPLTACSDDDGGKAGNAGAAKEAKPSVTCMDHQEVAVALKAPRSGLPDIDTLVGRSWEPDDGRTDPDAHGTACATLDLEEPPAGWRFVRADLRLTDGPRTTTVSTTALDGFGLDADMWAYECVAIDGTVVLAKAGRRATWAAHTEVSPRCKG